MHIYCNIIDIFNSTDFQGQLVGVCLNQDFQDYRIFRIVEAILSSESRLSQMIWITRIVDSVKLRRSERFSEYSE